MRVINSHCPHPKDHGEHEIQDSSPSADDTRPSGTNRESHNLEILLGWLWTISVPLLLLESCDQEQGDMENSNEEKFPLQEPRSTLEAMSHIQARFNYLG